MIRRPRFLAAVPALLALALAAGSAGAEPARLRLDPPASRFDGDQARRAAGIARTAVDQPLASRGTAAVRFLCGLAPSDRGSGAASALGTDHDGRFLGAQLRFGFR